MCLTFQTEEDKETVWNGRPWNILGKHILIQKWEEYKANINNNITTFWVQIYDIPASYVSLEAARKVGNRLGEIISIELPDPKEKYTEESFCRVRINWDITKPLIMGAFFFLAPGNKIWIRLKYEKLCHCCYKCGLLDHEETNCSNPNKLMNKIGKFIRAPEASLDHRKKQKIFPFVFVGNKSKGNSFESNNQGKQDMEVSQLGMNHNSVINSTPQISINEKGQFIQRKDNGKAVGNDSSPTLQIKEQTTVPLNFKIETSSLKNGATSLSPNHQFHLTGPSTSRPIIVGSQIAGPFQFGKKDINPKNESPISPCFFGTIPSPKLNILKSPISNERDNKIQLLENPNSEKSPFSLNQPIYFSIQDRLAGQNINNGGKNKEKKIENSLFYLSEPSSNTTRRNVRTTTLEEGKFGHLKKNQNQEKNSARNKKLWAHRTVYNNQHESEDYEVDRNEEEDSNASGNENEKEDLKECSAEEVCGFEPHQTLGNQ